MDFDLKKENDGVHLAYKGDTHERGRGAQIVFIHGLQLNENERPHVGTWLSEDGVELWPKSWLSASFPSAAIYLVHYDSSVHQDDTSGRLDLYATAESILQNLFLAGIGLSPKHPLILVGQDVGGLIIKEICLQASSRQNLASKAGKGSSDGYNVQSFLTQLKGVIYFSTPHGGLHHWDPDYQGELMKTLKVHDASTSRLNEEFRKLRRKYDWKAFGLGASQKDEFDIKEGSARSDVDEFSMINATTSSICKPRDRNSSSFLQLKKFIGESLGLSLYTNPRRPVLQFGADPLYVPLVQTLKEVQEELAKPDFKVVALCGDSGTGKSCLAKYLALFYMEEPGSQATFCDGVFFFHCGRGADRVSLMRNMLRELKAAEHIVASKDSDLLSFTLRDKLKDLNALMIFDDVWECENLIETLVFPAATEVKFLLTSQQSSIWSAYNVCKIADIDLRTAQEIVAKQIGFQDARIPDGDEEIVNEIIAATEFHPLALATVGIAVQTKDGGVSRQQWEDVKKNLLSYLGEEHEEFRAKSFGRTYPRSVFASMMYAVQVLRKESYDSFHLMCMVALFQESLPESVFFMFMLCTRPNHSEIFMKSMKRLERRQLVQTISRRIPLAWTSVDDFSRVVRSLRMHSLRRQFIIASAGSTSTSSPINPRFETTIQHIKKALDPFLSDSKCDTKCDTNESKRNSKLDYSVSTALFALYGSQQVNAAAVRRLMTAIPVRRGDVCALHEELTRLSRAEPNPGITSTREDFPELVKMVLNHVHTQLDDGNIAVLISANDHVALEFLLDYVNKLKSLAGNELVPAIQKTLTAAIHLLHGSDFGSTTNPRNQSQPIMVLNLLHQLALPWNLTERAASIIVELPGVELLVSLLNKGTEFQPELQIYLSPIIELFCALAEREGLTPRVLSLLQAGRSIPKAIMSILQALVRKLNSSEFLNEHLSDARADQCMSTEIYNQNNNGSHAKSISIRFRTNLFIVQAALMAVKLLQELHTLADETAVATIKSIFKPLQGVVWFLRQSEWEEEAYPIWKLHILAVYALNRIFKYKDDRGRSYILTIPGAIEGLVSLIRDQSLVGGAALRSLREFILFDQSDDFVRSYVVELPCFFVLLVDVIANHDRTQDEVIDALAILKCLITTDATATTAASCLNSLLPNVCQTLTDLLKVPTRKKKVVPPPSSSITDRATYIEDGSGREGYFPLRVMNPQPASLSETPNALHSLLQLLHNSDSRAAQSAACDLLVYVMRYAEVRRILTMPGALTQLIHLLDVCGNNSKVKETACRTLFLITCSKPFNPHAVLQVAAVPGGLEGVFKLMRNLDGQYHYMAGYPIKFVWNYRCLQPAESVSRIVAIPGAVEAIVVYIEKSTVWPHACATALNEALNLLRVICEEGNQHLVGCQLLAVPKAIEAFVRLVFQNKSAESRKMSMLLLEDSSRFVQGIVPKIVAVTTAVHDLFDYAHMTTIQIGFLYNLATQSEDAITRIVASQGLKFLELIVDLLDEKQLEWTQMVALTFVGLLAHTPSQGNALSKIMAVPAFFQNFSTLLHSSEREKLKFLGIETLTYLAGAERIAVSEFEQIIELISDALQDYFHQLNSTDEAQVGRVLAFLGQLCIDSQKTTSLIMKIPGALDTLITLSIHAGEEIRVVALDILALLCRTGVFHNEELYLFQILDSLPGVVEQFGTQESTADGDDQVGSFSALHLVRCLVTANYCKEETRSLVLAISSGLIVDDPQALGNVVALLHRNEPGRVHLDAMVILSCVAASNPTSLSRIVQISGTLERIVELVFRSKFVFEFAFSFLKSLIVHCKVSACAPPYLLRCLAKLARSHAEKETAIAAVKLLGICASRNTDALYLLIDVLRCNTRCALRAAAMAFLISHALVHSELRKHSLVASLQRLACELDPDHYPESGVCDVQVNVLEVLASLAESSLKRQLRIATYVTGIYSHQLQENWKDLDEQAQLAQLDQLVEVMYSMAGCTSK